MIENSHSSFHGEPTPKDDSWRPAPGKKNTRKWCKGKVGREHTPVVQLDKGGHTACQVPNPWRVDLWAATKRYYRPWLCYHREVCSTCGKILRWYVEPVECPDIPPAIKKELTSKP